MKKLIVLLAAVLIMTALITPAAFAQTNQPVRVGDYVHAWSLNSYPAVIDLQCRNHWFNLWNHKYCTSNTPPAHITWGEVRAVSKDKRWIYVHKTSVGSGWYSRWDKMDSEPKLAQPTSTTDSCWYVVKAGDYVSTIAQREHARPSDILRWNGIEDADLIHPGKRLRVCP